MKIELAKERRMPVPGSQAEKGLGPEPRSTQISPAGCQRLAGFEAAHARRRERLRRLLLPANALLAAATPN